MSVSGGNQARIDASMHTLDWFEKRGYRFRRLTRRRSDQLVSADQLAPLLRRREWYEYLMSVSAERRT